MKAPEYRISYSSNKKKIIIFLIILIALLLIIFRPLTWLRQRLLLKAMLYNSTHEPVDLSFNIEKEYVPLQGTIIRDFNKNGNGIDIAPSSSNTAVRPIDQGIVMKIGSDAKDGNYVLIRHVSETKKGIYYSYYSHLPSVSNLKVNEWTSPGIVMYSGNLDYLHFEVRDFYENQLDPTPYIHIN